MPYCPILDPARVSHTRDAGAGADTGTSRGVSGQGDFSETRFLTGGPLTLAPPSFSLGQREAIPLNILQQSPAIASLAADPVMPAREALFGILSSKPERSRWQCSESCGVAEMPFLERPG